MGDNNDNIHLLARSTKLFRLRFMKTLVKPRFYKYRPRFNRIEH